MSVFASKKRESEMSIECEQKKKWRKKRKLPDNLEVRLSPLNGRKTRALGFACHATETSPLLECPPNTYHQSSRALSADPPELTRRASPTRPAQCGTRRLIVAVVAVEPADSIPPDEGSFT
jgi:hypothetical protein